MKRYLTFLVAGTGFSTVEEFLTVAVLKRDIPSYVFTLIVFFPVFLTIVFLLGCAADRTLSNSRYRDTTLFLGCAMIGMLIEWFLIGLSPWSDPAANPLLMLAFQLGMFSFWATVSFAPRLYIQGDEFSAKTRRTILRFYVPYFLFVYIVAFAVPDSARFATIITLIIVGYGIVACMLVRYLRNRAGRGSQPLPEVRPQVS